jgi:hypothetical protein
MLDLDHPRTQHIFAASHQLDMILDMCKRITLSSVKGRRFRLEGIRQAFATLRWLAAHRFADEPHIADGIAELERQAEQLAALSLCHPISRDSLPERCPVCGDTLILPSEYSPTGYCSSCLGVIRAALQRVRSCEEGFGTEAI